MAGVTVTCNVTGVAHSPMSGVKTYDPLALLSITDGNHEPLIPLGEVVDSAGTVSPWHIESVVAKSGVVMGATSTKSVNGEAHWPTVGVKTYEPFVVVSMVEGDQVPLIPFGDVAAKIGAAAPWQTVKGVVKSGAKSGFTVTAKVSGSAHCVASGVKR